jgi:hypothetical protein
VLKKDSGRCSTRSSNSSLTSSPTSRDVLCGQAGWSCFVSAFQNTYDMHAAALGFPGGLQFVQPVLFCHIDDCLDTSFASVHA